MSLEHVYHCDGPGCEVHARVLAALGRPPVGFLLVTSYEEPDHHFCSWDCAMKFAAQREPMTVIRPDAGQERDRG
jgi:hypothetical protein